MSIERINQQLAVLLGDGLADWQREELAERLARLAPAVRRQALAQLPVIWPVSFALYYAFVEQLAPAATCLHPSQIPAWAKAALDVYEADGLRAAQDFLARVEETFLCQLRGEAGVRLLEVEPRLLPYARGLLGRELKLAPARQASFDTNTVFLPDELDLFSEVQQNFLLYKLSVTFLLALDRLGTFRAQEGATHVPQPLSRFVGRFPDPALMADIFYLVEAVRIVARLQGDFPGLMADVAGLMPRLIEVYGPQAAGSDQAGLVGALRLWLLHQIEGLDPDADSPLPTAVRELLAGLRQPGGTAARSLAVSEELYPYAAALGGPYQRDEPLPFMGELTVAAAYQGIEARQAEREEKLIEALSRMIAEQGQSQPKPGAGDQEEGQGEDETAPGRPALEGEQGSQLLMPPGAELPAAELERQMEEGVLRIGAMEFELSDELKDLLREMVAEQGSLSGQAIVSAAGRAGQGLSQAARSAEDDSASRASGPLRYDEWDYRRGGFRKHWCQVQVKEVLPVAGNFVANTLAKYRGLLVTLRRQFEMMRVQESFVKRQRDGNDIDLDAVVEAVADMRAGLAPSERLFIRLQRNDRQIAALFLLDMSSSTEGWVSTALKEALILMCESLSALGDRYAIYGFSGMRRLRSEVFTVKRFDEPYDATIKARIAAITPKEYTRMGPAIRHASAILAATEARVRLLITLSDGKPEDYDGYKGAYAIEDTRHALIEAKTAGIHPFCITVDREAHGYMAHMYGEINYIFIDQVAKLPRRMPEIYRNLTS